MVKTSILGLSLLTGEGVGVAVLAAVFLSNLPEAIAATNGLVAGGWSRGGVLGLWTLVALVCALAALAGYVLLDGASPRTVAIVLAFVRRFPTDQTTAPRPGQHCRQVDHASWSRQPPWTERRASLPGADAAGTV